MKLQFPELTVFFRLISLLTLGLATSLYQAEAQSSNNIGVWNRFLGMVNIVELVNRSEQTKEYEVKFYSNLGEELTSIKTLLTPGLQFDIILDDYTNTEVKAENYGTYEVIGDPGSFSTRTVFYQLEGVNFGKFDYSFPLKLLTPLQGTSYTSFNTFQPFAGMVPISNFSVYNWLSIINLENKPLTYDVNFYMTRRNVDGGQTLVNREMVTIAAGQRYDLPAGHQYTFPFTGVITDLPDYGNVEIVPQSSDSKYLANLIRYDAEGYMASPFSAFKGSDADVRYLPIRYTQRSDIWNFIEYGNLTDSTMYVRVKLIFVTDEDAKEYQGATVNILGNDSFIREIVMAKEQEPRPPFNPSIILDNPNQVLHGFAKIQCVVSFSDSTIIPCGNMLSWSSFYSVDQNQNVSTYAIPDTAQSGATDKGSFNTFLNQKNELTISNPNESTTLNIKITARSYLGDVWEFNSEMSPSKPKL